MKHRSNTSAKRPKAIPFVTAAICMVAILAIGVFAVACGGTAATPGTTAGGGVSTTAAGGTSGTQVALKNFAFDPANVTIKAGESVTWTNQDSVTHDVTADNGEFKSGSLANGATFSFTFAKAGTYPYHCGIHPTMKGTITVQ